jgi:hypothetical protein
VPVEGIEPPLLAEHDFESCASTSSATRASGAFYIVRIIPAQKKIKTSQPRRQAGSRPCIRPQDRHIAAARAAAGLTP